jgi:hypothetical protein
VGDEVVAQVRAAIGSNAEKLLTESDGGIHFDLAAANRWWLEQAGVIQIEDSGICTAENLEDWYSHRGENGNTGRFGVLLALEAQ